MLRKIIKYAAGSLLIFTASIVFMAVVIGGDPEVEEIKADKQTEQVEVKEEKPDAKNFENEVKENQAKAAAELEASRVSMEEFQVVEEGMTFEEVSEVTGAYLELLSESGSAQIYMADGVGSLGANANFTFVDGKLYAKAQFGLGGN